MTTRLLALLCLLLAGLNAVAQQPDWLPRFRAPGELEQASDFKLLPPPNGAITHPPSVPVRMMAEWEELQAVAISWQLGEHNDILTEIVRAARTECNVMVHCSSQSGIDQAKTYLKDRGVEVSSRVQFLIARSNSIWIRDYGPSSVYARDVDSLLLIDWIYNRPRRRDDTLAVKVAQQLNVPLYTTTTPPYDLVNTGGNVMTDGMGTAFSSELVLEENGMDNVWGQSNHTEAAVDHLMQQFMGIDRYLKMDVLPYDGIHHIDMHLKLLDEETLLVGEYPAGVSDGPQIEANIQYLLSKLSSFGQTYRIVRIPMPPFDGQYPPFGGSANKAYLYPTYVNSLIVNKTILMPKYNIPLDITAQKIFERSMPGYKVVPINCTDIVDEGGALHCITKEIGVPDPLRIVHRPISYIVQGINDPVAYPVNALLQHRTGIANAQVWYTNDSSSVVWQSVPMYQSVHPDSVNYWNGNIPRIAFSELKGQPIYYYVEAVAQSGKKQVRPMPAPKGWWKFRVIPDVSAISEASTAQLMAPFPNPAAAITCIPLQTASRVNGSIQLTNALGQVVYTIYEGVIAPGSNQYFFDAALFASGVYFVTLQSEGKTLARQLLIRK